MGDLFLALGMLISSLFLAQNPLCLQPSVHLSLMGSTRMVLATWHFHAHSKSIIVDHVCMYIVYLLTGTCCCYILFYLFLFLFLDYPSSSSYFVISVILSEQFTKISAKHYKARDNLYLAFGVPFQRLVD